MVESRSIFYSSKIVYLQVGWFTWIIGIMIELNGAEHYKLFECYYSLILCQLLDNRSLKGYS